MYSADAITVLAAKTYTYRCY